MTYSPRVSITILNWNRRKYISCLDSLLEAEGNDWIDLLTRELVECEFDVFHMVEGFISAIKYCIKKR